MRCGVQVRARRKDGGVEAIVGDSGGQRRSTTLQPYMYVCVRRRLTTGETQVSRALLPRVPRAWYQLLECLIAVDLRGRRARHRWAREPEASGVPKSTDAGGVVKEAHETPGACTVARNLAPLHTACTLLVRRRRLICQNQGAGDGRDAAQPTPRQGTGPTVNQALPSSPPSPPACRSPLERGSALTN